MLPGWTSPALLAQSTDMLMSSSVEWAYGITSGVMPQCMLSWRCTCSSSTQATIGVSGRQRLSRRAVMPLLETVMMALAWMSCAVVQAACAMAALTLRRVSLAWAWCTRLL